MPLPVTSPHVYDALALDKSVSTEFDAFFSDHSREPPPYFLLPDPFDAFNGDDPLDATYIPSAEARLMTPQKNLKSGDDRRLYNLYKRLDLVTPHRGLCTITQRQSFCSTVQCAHCMDRADSWNDPSLMLCLEYYLGFAAPGMLNLDTRLNFWEVEATYHVAADHGAFGHLLAIHFLRLVLAFILRNKKAGLNNREKFTDALKPPNGKTWPYEMLCILMDEFHPIARKRSPTKNKAGELKQSKTAQLHKHPYATIGTLELHMHPVFAIVSLWNKLQKWPRQPFWTREEREAIDLVYQIMEEIQVNPPSEFLARKRPTVDAPDTPSKKGKAGSKLPDLPINEAGERLLAFVNAKLAARGNAAAGPSGTRQSTYQPVPAIPEEQEDDVPPVKGKGKAKATEALDDDSAPRTRGKGKGKTVAFANEASPSPPPQSAADAPKAGPSRSRAKKRNRKADEQDEETERDGKRRVVDVAEEQAKDAAESVPSRSTRSKTSKTTAAPTKGSKRK
ncbi:hypothetical protein CPB85DRAFT_1435593 [Mucidula mucida]|nr:hypothetical protein CPB85DRAFT_1435593 [Mucidula mucida]